MLRGTRIIEGKDAYQLRALEGLLVNAAQRAGYEEVVIPSIWEQATFVDKAGPEVLGQMYTFKDKGDRDICLIPEVTAIIQQLYREMWAKSRKKPVRVFYVSRCYRYERPQAGRHREFRQFGVECLGGKFPTDENEVTALLAGTLNAVLHCDQWDWKDSVKRGLDYYTEDGFEVEVPSLGAQKQVAGGGRYEGGIGFAIGMDRLLLAMQGEKVND